MTGEKAKLVLQLFSSQLIYSGTKVKETNSAMDAIMKDFCEAVKIACEAIDMVEDRLDIDSGGKQDE